MGPQVNPDAPSAPADLAGAPVFCSWSGGKDSALALLEAVRAGARPRFLLSMMTEGGGRSRSHGLARELLVAQAAAIGVPIHFGTASWGEYRDEYLRVLGEAVLESDTSFGVFGDIDVDDHRGWVEEVCAEVGAKAILPLWQRERRAVVDELLEAGFVAMIVAVRDGVLPTSLLGRVLDTEVVAEIEAAGADACGEAGEYHTFVVDGPMFSEAVEVDLGETCLRDGVWFVDLLPRERTPG
jgi:uncharacterized protein (TIGR00290 family)